MHGLRLQRESCFSTAFCLAEAERRNCGAATVVTDVAAMVCRVGVVAWAQVGGFGAFGRGKTLGMAGEVLRLARRGRKLD